MNKHTVLTNRTNEQSDELFAAFELFSQISGQLESSYKDLETQVEQLHRELAAANSEKLRQLAEKEKLANQLQTLIETMPAAVLGLDDQLQVISVNATAKSLFNITAEQQVVPLSWQELLSSNQVVFDGHELRFSDNRVYSYHISALNMHDSDNVEGHIIILTDVTQTRQLQQTLNRQQRLAELGELIAGIAHQVRTPLSSARLSLEQLNNPAANDAFRQRAIRRINNNLQHLEELINDTLQFARGEEYDQDLVSVSKLMLAVHESIRSCNQKNIPFRVTTISPDCYLAGSFDALLSAVMSLVENALNTLANQSDACLDVSVNIENDILQLRVTDNGPGMTAEQKTKIFQPFYTTRKEGTGLGLAIASSIIKAHQGRITIDSEADTGTSMIIELNRISKQEFMSSGHAKTAGIRQATEV